MISTGNSQIGPETVKNITMTSSIKILGIKWYSGPVKWSESTALMNLTNLNKEKGSPGLHKTETQSTNMHRITCTTQRQRTWLMEMVTFINVRFTCKWTQGMPLTHKYTHHK